MAMTGPKQPPIPEREDENGEYRYLDEDEVNDEEVTRYKTFSIG